MKSITTLILFFTFVSFTIGQVIPEDKRIDWSTAGYVGDFS